MAAPAQQRRALELSPLQDICKAAGRHLGERSDQIGDWR